MKRVEILKKLENAGIIAVIRGESKEEAIAAAHAVVRGGIMGLELTFTVPQADEAIRTLAVELSQNESVIIGAGTVLDAFTARLAIMAGAEYIVSPSFDKETAELCNLYQVPYLPGCMTVTEMKTALKSGADIIKLFPGNAFDPGIVKAFKTPLPQVNIMPTGGVDIDNMEEWFKQGVIAVGVGGSLLNPAKTGDFAGVTAAAEAYIRKLREIRGESDE